jgi:hypothetical protein
MDRNLLSDSNAIALHLTPKTADAILGPPPAEPGELPFH